MTTMIDATGASCGSIPAATPVIAGYVTGSGIVPWTAADWARFPRAGHVRIDQTARAADPLGADVLDVETGAATPADVPGWVKTRIAAGIRWSTIYGTGTILAIVQADLKAAGPAGWYDGHVDCWLADWNLDEAAAAKLLGTLVHGMTCRAVQWASPSSNPRTVVPGGTRTLAEANVDLSVTQDGWHAYVAPAAPRPAPAPVAAELEGILVQLPGGTSRKVLSKDAGKTWE